MRLKEEYSKHALDFLQVHLFYKLCKVYIEVTVMFPEIEPWTFEQHVGEAVIIPAGCPYQIRNSKVSFTYDGFSSPSSCLLEKI